MKIILNNRKSGLGFVAVFDLDGTLSDDSWRSPIALQARLAIDPGIRDQLWKKYHSQCGYDKPHMSVKGLFHFYKSKGLEVWVVTARPESLKTETIEWLQHNIGFLPNLLAMRPEGNKDKARDLKRNFLVDRIDKDCVGYIAIIDNSPEVIEECQKLGDAFLFKPQDSL
jgi:hypothetical protein